MANNAARPNDIRSVANDVNNICKKLQPPLNTLVEGLLEESRQTNTKNSYTETWESINKEVNGQCASAKTLIGLKETPTGWGELHAKSVEYLQSILDGLPPPTNSPQPTNSSNNRNNELKTLKTLTETLKTLTETFTRERTKAQKVINAIVLQIKNYSNSSPTREQQDRMEQQLVKGAEAASEQTQAFAQLLKEFQAAQKEPISNSTPPPPTSQPSLPIEASVGGGRQRKTRKQKKRSHRSRHRKQSKKRYR